MPNIRMQIAHQYFQWYMRFCIAKRGVRSSLFLYDVAKLFHKMHATQMQMNRLVLQSYSLTKRFQLWRLFLCVAWLSLHTRSESAVPRDVCVMRAQCICLFESWPNRVWRGPEYTRARNIWYARINITISTVCIVYLHDWVFSTVIIIRGANECSTIKYAVLSYVAYTGKPMPLMPNMTLRY